ncbi:MAG TPA: hypothetical protein VGI40_28230 [Pirellulaceae bacterium]|jgi:hypothetical protein
MDEPPIDKAAHRPEPFRDFRPCEVFGRLIRGAKSCSSVVLLFTATCLSVFTARAEETRLGIYNTLHEYNTRAVDDRFSRFLSALDAGKKPEIDTSGDLAFLRSLLEELKVPVSSQMLVFTATSLQKGLISARNPRALYFNDDTYVGFVPRGRVEVISLDPELGGIFYIFDRLQPGRRPQVHRAFDCMNCHAPRHMENIPGLVIESVIPGLTGGGERAFRREQSGHGVPIADRFGGWHLTGTGEAMPPNWSNQLLIRKNGEAHELPNPPGERCDLSRYLVPISDLLAQLLHEHQVGFVNRALQAGYRYRDMAANGSPSEGDLAELSAVLVRYLLFADESPLVPGMIGDSPFAADFVAAGKRDSAGRSLRALDGQTRLLKYRCSYMIYSPAFSGLPTPLRQRVLRDLNAELGDGQANSHLPVAERTVIRQVLAETMPDFAEAGRG